MTNVTAPPGGATCPATAKESGLWLLESLVPGTGVNNLSVAFQVDGRLSTQALSAAVAHLLRRYEVLRTVFRETPDGLVRRVLPPSEATVPVQRRVGTGDDPLPELTAFVAGPFQPDDSLLLRALHLAHPTGDVCCLAVHHAVFDTLSAGPLLRDLIAGYEAALAGSPVPGALGTQVPAWTEPEPDPAGAQYWRRQLAGLDPAAMELAVGRPDPARITLVGDEVTRSLSAAAVAAVQRLTAALRAPESVVLLAGYALLLADHGAGPDLTIGAPVSARTRQAADAVGYHVGMLVLRLLVDRGGGFADLVRSARRVFLEGMRYAAYPVELLTDELPRTGSGWRNQLFRHVFNYLPVAGPAGFTVGGRPARQLVVENGGCRYDLSWMVSSGPGAIHIRAAFTTDVFDRDDVDLLLRRYDALLVRVGQQPDEPVRALSGWCDLDREVIAAANATDRPARLATVPAAVAGWVRARPQAPAVVDGDRVVSYGQLWGAAVATRDALAAAGVGNRDVVALLVRRGPALAAAALGAWLAGAAYLPIDPDHPAQRIAHQLADSAAAAIVTGPGLQLPPAQVPAGACLLPAVDPEAAAPAVPTADPAVDPDAPAYLIYTSGSTGRPKGTTVTHRSLANVIGHFADELGIGPGDTTLWQGTFSFDASALELYLPLVTGGRLAVAPDEARTDGAAMRQLLHRFEVTVLHATPTTLGLVLDDCAEQLASRHVLSGGEPLPAVLAGRLLSAGCRLRNVYGPTETTISSVSGELGAVGADPVDIGTPIANTRVFVVGADGRELPVGVRGELCIAGAGVSLGYHRLPDLTAQRFGSHPLYGRYYRTGDLARWLRSGRLALSGRVDRQVKLRGNRIELGEVEGVLLAHPEVSGAAVVVAGEGPDAVLTAFLLTGPGPTAPLPTDQLWEHCRRRLPIAAVPQVFVPIDRFPLTGSGKVDHRALRALAADPGQRTAGASADPATVADELVADLVRLWRTLLDRADAGPDSHFFATGGNSLLGARLTQEVQRLTGIRPRLTDVFDHPTPAALARRLRADGAAG